MRLEGAMRVMPERQPAVKGQIRERLIEMTLSQPNLEEYWAKIGLPTTLWRDLKERYEEPGRAYHTLRHLEELLGHFGQHRKSIHNQQVVLLALFFHDAVYQVPSPPAQNENQSADLMADSCSEYIGQEDVLLADVIIRSTASHEPPDSLLGNDAQDAALFLDMDLAILGSSPDRYKQYTAQIRREYAVFPDDVYIVGRRAVLERFLTRDRLYFTQTFFDQFEDAARSNIAAEIKSLRADGAQ